MKIYKFDELELFSKPNIIKIIGQGYINKHHLSNKLLISYHDKKIQSSSSNPAKIDKLELTIFTIECLHHFPRNMYNITQHYIAYDKFKDFYLLRKYYIKKNPNLHIHIILVDYNMNCRRIKNKYLQKLIDGYKKLNLVIIYYEYFLSFDYKEADYILALNDFESFVTHTYDYMCNKEKYCFEKFYKIYKKITESDGVMVLKKGINNKMYKLSNLSNKKEERDRIKKTNPNYDPLSDESNIFFF